MRRSEQQPVIPEKWVMALRLAIVLACYALYRLLEPEHGVMPAVFVGTGVLIFVYTLIDRYALWRRERSGMMQVAQTILGIGLALTGLVLILT